MSATNATHAALAAIRGIAPHLLDMAVTAQCFQSSKDTTEAERERTLARVLADCRIITESAAVIRSEARETVRGRLEASLPEGDPRSAFGGAA